MNLLKDQKRENPVNEALAVKDTSNDKVPNTGSDIQLLDNPNTRFLEDSVALITRLSHRFYSINVIIDDDNKLRKYAYDYRRLSFIKNIFETNINNPQAALFRLSQHIQFMEKYNKELLSSGDFCSGGGSLE